MVWRCCSWRHRLESNHRAKFQVFNICKIANLFPYRGTWTKDRERESEEVDDGGNDDDVEREGMGRLSLLGNGSYFKYYALRMMHDFVEPQMVCDPRTVYSILYEQYMYACAMCVQFECCILFELNRALRPEHNRFGISLWHRIVFNQTEATISHSYK